MVSRFEIASMPILCTLFTIVLFFLFERDKGLLSIIRVISVVIAIVCWVYYLVVLYAYSETTKLVYHLGILTMIVCVSAIPCMVYFYGSPRPRFFKARNRVEMRKSLKIIYVIVSMITIFMGFLCAIKLMNLDLQGIRGY